MFFLFFLKIFLCFQNILYFCIRITMDKTFITIEEQIVQVLADVSREVVKLVNFITATKRTDKKEFNGKRYVKNRSRQQHRVKLSALESEGNQAARSNCSSSHRCHRSSHRGSTWFLLSRCKDTNYFVTFQTNLDLFCLFSQNPHVFQRL